MIISVIHFGIIGYISRKEINPISEYIIDRELDIIIDEKLNGIS